MERLGNPTNSRKQIIPKDSGRKRIGGRQILGEVCDNDRGVSEVTLLLDRTQQSDPKAAAG